MKYIILSFFSVLIGVTSYCQQTRFYNDPQETYKQAKEYFQKEQYSLAYPLLKDLDHKRKETDRINEPIVDQEIQYYLTVCGLKQNEDRAANMATEYIEVEKNNPRTQMMSFHLAEYHFRKENFAEAVQLYEQANIANLSNREIADMNFHQGYAYFTMQNFAAAKPLFNTIRQMPDDPNYIGANYYYGFIAFRDRNYSDALQSFKVVENEENYLAVVPYYIAQIYYVQGQKDEAIAYAEQKMKSGNAQYYDLELKQLLGHAYFEKKEYAKALPYLEDYVNRSKKVSREDLYELSYSYYQANNYNKAIEGFKQLSGNEDSLSQHSMYLLGDSYLKTNQKSNARNAFLFSSSNSSNVSQKEISRFNYGKLSYELGYQDEALNVLQSFINEYPNSTYIPEATELMVAVLANTNNYRDALSMLEQLQNPSANTRRLYPRILYGRATELANDGMLPEADALLDKALKDANNGSVFPFVQFWKGEIAYRQNRIDDAIRFYHDYISAGAPTSGEVNSINARYNLGYCYFRKENYSTALTFFEQVIKNPTLNADPVTQDAYVRSADCYYMARDYNRARTMYDNVIRFSWSSEDYATFQKAMIAGINNQTEKINLMNTLIRKFPNSFLVADANMEIASSYLASERFRDAIPFLNNVIKASGNSSLKPRAMLRLGLVYYNLNNNTEALNQYKQLVSQYPNSEEAQDALENIQTIYVDQNQPTEYADFMRQAGKALSVSAEDELTWTAALSQYNNGNLNEALTSFNNYLQRFPQGKYALDANYFSAEIYYGRKDWKNAMKGYEYVASLSPNKYAENALLLGARTYFFEFKDYNKAEDYYQQLKNTTNNQENRLEAMRGLLRSQYQLQKWTQALENAKELAAAKGSSADDRALANMAIAKSHQVNGVYDLAITHYKTVVSLNKAALAAEARYEIANSWLQVDKLAEAEKAAFETINKSGSYDHWVTKSYILLGDVFYKQKDYFNAKATFQSVIENTINAELKKEAQTKLNLVIEAEAKNSKVSG